MPCLDEHTDATKIMNKGNCLGLLYIPHEGQPNENEILTPVKAMGGLLLTLLQDFTPHLLREENYTYSFVAYRFTMKANVFCDMLWL